MNRTSSTSSSGVGKLEASVHSVHESATQQRIEAQYGSLKRNLDAWSQRRDRLDGNDADKKPQNKRNSLTQGPHSNIVGQQQARRGTTTAVPSKVASKTSTTTTAAPHLYSSSNEDAHLFTKPIFRKDIPAGEATSEFAGDVDGGVRPTTNTAQSRASAKQSRREAGRTASAAQMERDRQRRVMELLKRGEYSSLFGPDVPDDFMALSDADQYRVTLLNGDIPKGEEDTTFALLTRAFKASQQAKAHKAEHPLDEVLRDFIKDKPLIAADDDDEEDPILESGELSVLRGDVGGTSFREGAPPTARGRSPTSAGQQSSEGFDAVQRHVRKLYNDHEQALTEIAEKSSKRRASVVSKLRDFAYRSTELHVLSHETDEQRAQLDAQRNGNGAAGDAMSNRDMIEELLKKPTLQSIKANTQGGGVGDDGDPMLSLRSQHRSAEEIRDQIRREKLMSSLARQQRMDRDVYHDDQELYYGIKKNARAGDHDDGNGSSSSGEDEESDEEEEEESVGGESGGSRPHTPTSKRAHIIETHQLQSGDVTLAHHRLGRKHFLSSQQRKDVRNGHDAKKRQQQSSALNLSLSSSLDEDTSQGGGYDASMSRNWGEGSHLPNADEAHIKIAKLVLGKGGQRHHNSRGAKPSPTATTTTSPTKKKIKKLKLVYAQEEDPCEVADYVQDDEGIERYTKDRRAELRHAILSGGAEELLRKLGQSYGTIQELQIVLSQVQDDYAAYCNAEMERFNALKNAAKNANEARFEALKAEIKQLKDLHDKYKEESEYRERLLTKKLNDTTSRVASTDIRADLLENEVRAMRKNDELLRAELVDERERVRVLSLDLVCARRLLEGVLSTAYIHQHVAVVPTPSKTKASPCPSAPPPLPLLLLPSDQQTNDAVHYETLAALAVTINATKKEHASTLKQQSKVSPALSSTPSQLTSALKDAVLTMGSTILSTTLTSAAAVATSTPSDLTPMGTLFKIHGKPGTEPPPYITNTTDAPTSFLITTPLKMFIGLPFPLPEYRLVHRDDLSQGMGPRPRMRDANTATPQAGGDPVVEGSAYKAELDREAADKKQLVELIQQQVNDDALISNLQETIAKAESRISNLEVAKSRLVRDKISRIGSELLWRKEAEHQEMKARGAWDVIRRLRGQIQPMEDRIKESERVRRRKRPEYVIEALDARCPPSHRRETLTPGSTSVSPLSDVSLSQPGNIDNYDIADASTQKSLDESFFLGGFLQPYIVEQAALLQKQRDDEKEEAERNTLKGYTHRPVNGSSPTSVLSKKVNVAVVRTIPKIGVASVVTPRRGPSVQNKPQHDNIMDGDEVGRTMSSSSSTATSTTSPSGFNPQHGQIMDTALPPEATTTSVSTVEARLYNLLGNRAPGLLDPSIMAEAQLAVLEGIFSIVKATTNIGPLSDGEYVPAELLEGVTSGASKLLQAFRDNYAQPQHQPLLSPLSLSGATSRTTTPPVSARGKTGGSPSQKGGMLFAVPPLLGWKSMASQCTPSDIDATILFSGTPEAHRRTERMGAYRQQALHSNTRADNRAVKHFVSTTSGDNSGTSPTVSHLSAPPIDVGVAAGSGNLSTSAASSKCSTFSNGSSSPLKSNPHSAIGGTTNLHNANDHNNNVNTHANVPASTTILHDRKKGAGIASSSSSNPLNRHASSTPSPFDALDVSVPRQRTGMPPQLKFPGREREDTAAPIDSRKGGGGRECNNTRSSVSEDKSYGDDGTAESIQGDLVNSPQHLHERGHKNDYQGDPPDNDSGIFNINNYFREGDPGVIYGGGGPSNASSSKDAFSADSARATMPEDRIPNVTGAADAHGGGGEFQPRHHVLTRSHTYHLKSNVRNSSKKSPERHLSSQAVGQLLRSVGGELLHKGASDDLTRKEREWAQEQRNRKLGLGYSFTQHRSPLDGMPSQTSDDSFSCKKDDITTSASHRPPSTTTNPSILRPVKVSPVEQLSSHTNHTNASTRSTTSSHHARPHSAASTLTHATKKTVHDATNIDLSVVGRPQDQHSIEALLCSAPPASYGKITASLGGGQQSGELGGVKGGREVINSLKPRNVTTTSTTARPATAGSKPTNVGKVKF